jgi:hypothetical protein
MDLPFTRRTALSKGETWYRLRSRMDNAELCRVRHGVYAVRRAEAAAVADPPNPNHALRAAAAIVRLEGAAAVSYESAASLWGLPVLGRKEGMHASRPRRCQGTTRAYPDLVLHHAALPQEHRDRVSGVPVTTPARTVVDIARARSFRAGVVVADSALRLRRCTREDLHRVARHCVRWPGSRQAREVIDFADDRSESPLESISRVAFHEWGLPAPGLQVWITEGECVDFLWARERVIGEADGLIKYRTPQDLWNEKARQERLVELGYVLVRWAWREVFWRPDALAHRIAKVLSRRS